MLFIDVFMGVLGGDLKCCECLFVCFGDILSGLYFGSIIFKWFDEDGCLKEDLFLFYWVM